jgi:hypothetical protein
MKVDTRRPKQAAAAQQMLEPSADSPLKGKRSAAANLQFSHFSRRYETKLGDSDIFHLRFNKDASLTAISFFDGSLQIISTMLGDQMYEIKDENMNFPITSLTWKPTYDDSIEH